MSANDINKMDYKQLRNEVQLLRDELAVMQRKYEDILYNLDDDNFSSTFLREKDGMKTAIKVTADGLESKVSNGIFESAIRQTNESISSVVSKNISAKFVSTEKPTTDNTSDAQKGMLCEYGGKLYYYNDIKDEWKIYPYADGIKSQFVQTSSGFDLAGDVYISGDAIVSGKISADRIDTTNLSCTRLYQQGKSSGAYAKINSNVGDFGIYNSSASDTATPNNSNCVYGVYSDVGFVELYIYGHQYLQYDGYQTKFYPKGTWDFTDSNCTLILPDGIGGGGGELAEGYLEFVFKKDGVNGQAGNAVDFVAFGDSFMGYNQDQETLYAKGKWDFDYAPLIRFRNTEVTFEGSNIDFSGANINGLANINVAAKFA